MAWHTYVKTIIPKVQYFQTRFFEKSWTRIAERTGLVTVPDRPGRELAMRRANRSPPAEMGSELRRAHELKPPLPSWAKGPKLTVLNE